MLPFCLAAGVNILDFWDLTIKEMTQVLKGHKETLREKAQFEYILAQLIGANVARILDKKNKVPAVYEVFPNLFEDPVLLEQQQKAIRAKQWLMKYATSHNAKVKRGV